MKISRRHFILSSAALTAAMNNSGPLDSALFAAETAERNRNYLFAESNDVGLDGLFGDSFARSVRRLALPPIDKVDFILADVNFNQKRIFTNFSGDISGRYIESASLTSTKEKPFPAILPEVIAKMPGNQKPDGHFGGEVDWNAPVDLAASTDRSLEMPILWGNGRLLLGLLAAYERFGDEKSLAAAKKLGDFYINIVIPRFCDPAKMDEYKKEAAGYAAAYVTCVYEGMEGLVRCWRLTKERKYLDAARRMADFHETFDVLPVGHSHGSISEHEALMMIYEETGEEKYFKRIVDRWERVVGEGFVNPCGSVAEKFFVSYESDEGCSESDWLRLNLMLWRATGKTRYLDFVERLLYNGWLANQWPSGGFGHRHFGVDEKGPFSWKKRYAESYWCCSYHGILGGYELKKYLAVGSVEENKTKRILVNFPLAFTVPLDFGGEEWIVRSRQEKASEDVPIRMTLALESKNGGKAALALRVPDWADDLAVVADGKKIAGEVLDGYWRSAEELPSGAQIAVDYLARPFLEDRRCRRIKTADQAGKVGEAVLRYGPDVYISRTSDGEKIEPLRLSRKSGALTVPESLGCFSKMTDAEREECHGFVFDVTVE